MTWPKFVIKIEVIYVWSPTWTLDVEHSISQELSNKIWAVFFYSEGVIVAHILSICSWILGMIWVQEDENTVDGQISQAYHLDNRTYSKALNYS
jgi:hypothetical protein